MNINSEKFTSVCYKLTLFLSAFLLFAIQPIIVKMITPYFGGTYTVWTTSVFFFQTLLLGGYAYSFYLPKLKTGLQPRFHAVIIIIFLALTGFLAFSDQFSFRVIIENLNSSNRPFLALFSALTALVAVPYFLLSTTSTLLQYWLNKLNNRASYTLYALSNAGSLLALVAYPLVIEPFISIHSQIIIWSAAFVAYCILMLVSSRIYSTGITENVEIITPDIQETAPQISRAQFLKWIGWSMLPSAMLITITNNLTLHIGSVPLLWLIPLVIYLLAFILAFSEVPSYLAQFLPFGLLLSSFAFLLINNDSLTAVLPANLSVLFFGSLYSAVRLYDLRPASEKLPAYYFIITAGGALGSLLISFIAPITFKGLWEVPIITILLIFLGSIQVTKDLNLKLPLIKRVIFIPKKLLVAGLIILCLFVMIRPMIWSGSKLIYQSRNFYGELKVQKLMEPGTGTTRYNLLNGSILHGYEIVDGKKPEPTAYYAPTSGVGIAISEFRSRSLGNMSIGVVGLGVGTLAAYGKPGDKIDFFEINPAVIDAANNYFTYLKTSEAQVEVILGDARLSMEKMINQTQYNLIALDAFTDDGIPSHLLTKEAFDIYKKLLEPENGVIAVHISSRYLDLIPVITGAAEMAELKMATLEDKEGNMKSIWVLMTNNASLLEDPLIADKAEPPLPQDRVIFWTDDYSPILPIMKI